LKDNPGRGGSTGKCASSNPPPATPTIGNSNNGVEYISSKIPLTKLNEWAEEDTTRYRKECEIGHPQS